MWKFRIQIQHNIVLKKWKLGFIVLMNIVVKKVCNTNWISHFYRKSKTPEIRLQKVKFVIFSFSNNIPSSTSLEFLKLEAFLELKKNQKSVFLTSLCCFFLSRWFLKQNTRHLRLWGKRCTACFCVRSSILEITHINLKNKVWCFCTNKISLNLVQ